MSRKNAPVLTQTAPLTSHTLSNTIHGFVRPMMSMKNPGLFARVLASAFLKFTCQGQLLLQTDSDNLPLDWSALHQDLTEEAQQFLQEDVPFLYEDHPIYPLLLHFAAFRLRVVSSRYYYATLHNHPPLVINDLKTQIKDRQTEYNALTQRM
jgi:hypothetical protein